MEKIRGKEISMIFQDPMTALNPILSIRKQIDEALQLHTTLSKGERLKASIELLRSVGIPNPEVRIDSFPHELSGGMRQRVIIAIAIATNPKLIIADEPVSALDVSIQAQIFNLLINLKDEFKLSFLLIAHDLSVVKHISDKI